MTGEFVDRLLSCVVFPIEVVGVLLSRIGMTRQRQDSSLQNHGNKPKRGDTSYLLPPV